MRRYRFSPEDKYQYSQKHPCSIETNKCGDHYALLRWELNESCSITFGKSLASIEKSTNSHEFSFQKNLPAFVSLSFVTYQNS